MNGVSLIDVEIESTPHRKKSQPFRGDQIFSLLDKRDVYGPCPLGAPAVKSSGTRSFTQNPGFPADMTIRLKLSKQKIKTLKIPTDRH